MLGVWWHENGAPWHLHRDSLQYVDNALILSDTAAGNFHAALKRLDAMTSSHTHANHGMCSEMTWHRKRVESGRRVSSWYLSERRHWEAVLETLAFFGWCRVNYSISGRRNKGLQRLRERVQAAVAKKADVVFVCLHPSAVGLGMDREVITGGGKPTILKSSRAVLANRAKSYAYPLTQYPSDQSPLTFVEEDTESSTGVAEYYLTQLSTNAWELYALTKPQQLTFPIDISSSLTPQSLTDRFKELSEVIRTCDESGVVLRQLQRLGSNRSNAIEVLSRALNLQLAQLELSVADLLRVIEGGFSSDA